MGACPAVPHRIQQKVEVELAPRPQPKYRRDIPRGSAGLAEGKKEGGKGLIKISEISCGGSDVRRTPGSPPMAHWVALGSRNGRR